MSIDIGKLINKNKDFTPTPTYKDTPEFVDRAAKEKKAWAILKRNEANGYDMASHYKKFVTIGSDEGKLQRAWNGFRKYTSEGATSITKLLGGNSSEYQNNIKEIELRENNWKDREVKKNPKLYKSRDDVWNVAGGIGEVTPYVTGGMIVGSSKAPALAGKIAGNVQKGLTVDVPLSLLQHGYKDDWDKEVAKEVILGVAGNGIGTGFSHVFSKSKPKLRSKTTKAATDINKEYASASGQNKVGDFIDDDKIVNKMMGDKSVTVPNVKTKEESKNTFGLDQVKENVNDGSVTNQNIKKVHTKVEDEIVLPKMQEVQDQIITPIKQQKLPDVLPTNREEMQDIIRYVIKNNAEDEFLSKLPEGTNVDQAREFLLNLKQPKPKTAGIEMPIVPVNKKEIIKTPIENIESKQYAKNQIASNGSQTFGGGVVGGLESDFNQRDYNNDGKHDSKDNVLGLLIGAVGITAAKKIMPKAFKDANIDKNTSAMFVGKSPKDTRLNAEYVIKNISDYSEKLNPEFNLLTVMNHFKKPIKTPIGDLEIEPTKLFNHLGDKAEIKFDKDGIPQYKKNINRLNYISYIKPTFEKPMFIVKNDKDKYTFFKPFIDENNKITKFINVVLVNGEIKAITSTPYKNTDIRNLIKKNERIVYVGGDTLSDASTPRMMANGNKSDIIETSIPKETSKSKDIKLHSSPTLSGAGAGALTGFENDFDGDGKITIKDILIGAGIGAGGTKSALLIKDTKIVSKASNVLKKVIDTDFVDAFSGHKLYGKKSYMNLREEMINSKNAKMEDFAQLHEQLALLSDGARKNIHKYMSGDKTAELSPALEKFSNNYISQIETMGKELVDLGILDPAQYEKFKGKYIHRVYEKDLTKSFAGAFQKGKTIQGVHTRGNEWSGTKTEYEKLLKNGEIGDFFDGKIEARRMNNGQYKFTQDWTSEQRVRWGEVEDVAYTLPETLMKMNDMLQHGKMLKGVVDDSKYVSDEAIDGYTQLQGKKFGALQGKYVPKDIASDITEFNSVMFGAEDNRIFSAEVIEAYKALSTFWKKSHTVYNPTGHVNNLMSNVTMQFMEGVNPITALKNAKDGAYAHAKLGEFRKLTAKKLIGLSNEESQQLRLLAHDDDLKLYIEADKAGLFGRSRLNDILSQYVNPKTKKGKGGILKKIDEKASAAYQGEDNIMRFSLLKSLVDRGDSFEEALKRVNNTIPDYTKPMSRMARFGRASMLTPFISWTYYSTPIILRQLKERPERALALMGTLYGINKMMGIDPYDNKEIPQKNFSMKRIPIYKNGNKVTTIKVDRWMPHNEILSPVDFIKNLYGMGAWGGAYEVLNNKNLYYGGKITHNEGGRKAYDIFKHGAQQITPDAIDKVWNLAESAILTRKQRKRKPVIQARSFTQEMINMAGINTLTYDKKAQRKKARSERLK